MSLKIDRNTKTLRELTLEKMRDAILGAYFHPGDRLVERTLCEELGVSRTVVREVLRHLETEGLVESLPQQGPIVARVDKAKASQIYELRALLEGHAAAAFAQQASEEAVQALSEALAHIYEAFEQHDFKQILKQTTSFYEVLFLGANQTVAWEMVQQLNARINRLRGMTVGSKDRSKESMQEMQALFDAVKARDAQKATEAAVYHVRKAGSIAISLLVDTPE
ncbi:GntR family transcriptional regulator [Leeia sp. TBRC 13508]|uniref:GntR family transcriptional regulator n=1 Tax=Leeia speluncae TaxID=2884804 RepID=A0ABS8D4C8_9NEIS|nr:GntR family transcriptional regulator [Leeia speluncae]MCB6183021.1 GntR family transcriptional regulator [Leeia speluncae]